MHSTEGTTCSAQILPSPRLGVAGYLDYPSLPGPGLAITQVECGWIFGLSILTRPRSCRYPGRVWLDIWIIHPYQANQSQQELYDAGMQHSVSFQKQYPCCEGDAPPPQPSPGRLQGLVHYPVGAAKWTFPSTRSTTIMYRAPTTRPQKCSFGS